MPEPRKIYRLWIQPDGDPVYVEWVTPHPLEEPIYLDRKLAEIHEKLLHRPVLLGPEWEIRVLTPSKGGQ